MATRERPSEDFIEQKITQQITITAGNTGRVDIDIPREKKVFLKGYGYSWFTSNTFNLSTGNTSFPSRSDQEGSPAIPVIFGTPFMCRSGGKLSLTITNGDSSDHTYDVVFYLVSNELLDVASTGGDLNLTIGGSGGISTSVAITDSTGSTFADVTSRGLETYNKAPATLLVGTATAGAAAAAIGSSTACEKITVKCPVGAANPVLVGNATAQSFELTAGTEVTLEVDNISKIYVKRNGGSDVTVQYIGS